jgi:hypothetical protein
LVITLRRKTLYIANFYSQKFKKAPDQLIRGFFVTCRIWIGRFSLALFALLGALAVLTLLLVFNYKQISTRGDQHQQPK